MKLACAWALFIAAGSALAGAGALEPAELHANGATIAVSFDEGKPDLPREAWLKWIGDGASAVSTYYGRFPVKKVSVRVVPQAGRGVHTAMTYGYPKPLIRAMVGARATAAELAEDWMIAHEMVHLAFPSVGDDQHWIEEGIATYVEPIARVQAGQLGADEVWRQLIEGLPKGLPARGDQGLDYTHTWGRTYWGGALFCMLAEVRIRERTRNSKGLQDALRAIVARGGSIEADWPLEQALKVGDEGTGTTVLSELYASMRAAPYAVDLEALWKKLGVKLVGGKMAYDDTAPQAAIRRAITQVTPPG